VNELFGKLQRHLATVSDLNAASAVLGWDQLTHMPPGGAVARGRHLATLSRLSHEYSIDPLVGQLLDDLSGFESNLPYDSFEASFIRVARRDYQQAVRVPAELAGRIAEHSSAAYGAWAAARPKNDFAAVQPMLETTLELSREVATCFPHDHPADPLINLADYGMTTASLKILFAELRAHLVPLIQAIAERPVADDRCLKQEFAVDKQLAFGIQLAQQLGYDLQRGRQDQTHHPFAIRMNVGDVRITTRVKSHDLSEALFSTIHETGHAMYEQGVDPRYDGSVLGSGTSSGVHESQSRLWENLVGRSRAFWEHYYPQLQATFADQLGNVELDTFYRAINKVERSLIRTDADEVTYNLHVIIRFDLELALLEGQLQVKDLPEAWRERYRSDLGILPPDDRDGVLQDVHWYGGLIGGAFQGYTIGNILSAQLFDTACRAHPEISEQISRGEFTTLHTWLRTNLYTHGRVYTAPELIERVTGGSLSIKPYVDYLTQKYRALYNF
jgi:carboxypeptidase Taq